MAGAGYKLFNTGDVLTAAQVNTYLQEQTVMVFANSTARTTALSGVLAEGMVSYLQDTNAVEVYNGSAWVGVSGAGDVTEVQAGTGISVASGTGPIPVVTNTMATEITAKGDLIVGTGSGTFDNLPVGTNGYTLVADSSVSPTGLKWAAPSSPTSTTWTAALSAATTNPTIGNGFRNAYYIKVGKLVIATFEWQFGSTSTSGSGQYKINSADLPATTATGLNFRGFGWFTDASTGNKYPLTLFRSGSDFLFYYGWPNGAGLVDFTAAAPVTIATNDSIDVQITYEASS